MEGKKENNENVFLYNFACIEVEIINASAMFSPIQSQEKGREKVVLQPIPREGCSKQKEHLHG